MNWVILNVSVCLEQTQYRVESALYGAYALIFVLEISVNNLYVNTVRPDFHQVFIYFRFVKGRCHLTQTMPPWGTKP